MAFAAPRVPVYWYDLAQAVESRGGGVPKSDAHPVPDFNVIHENRVVVTEDRSQTVDETANSAVSSFKRLPPGGFICRITKDVAVVLSSPGDQTGKPRTNAHRVREELQDLK